MNDKTLEALGGSIQKWTAVAHGEGEDDANDNCPLCGLFFDLGCTGCPIDDAGYWACTGTPYTRWCKHQKEVHGNPPNYVVRCPECRRLALEEVWFLCTLLPGEDDA